MNKVLELAENEMIDLKHPYVGTEHFFLAYLKCYPNSNISYVEFKNALIRYIGVGSIVSEYVLYTPLLRKYVASLHDEKEVIVKVLNDSDSIAFNVLSNMGVDVSKILNNL